MWHEWYFAVQNLTSYDKSRWVVWMYCRVKEQHLGCWHRPPCLWSPVHESAPNGSHTMSVRQAYTHINLSSCQIIYNGSPHKMDPATSANTHWLLLRAKSLLTASQFSRYSIKCPHFMKRDGTSSCSKKKCTEKLKFILSWFIAVVLYLNVY